MSRCGSCPIYDSEEYGVFCPGNCGVEDCADKLQNLYLAINDEIEKLKNFTYSNSPLTLEQLREMDGEPVYLSTVGNPTDGVWVLIHVEPNGEIHTIYSNGGTANYEKHFLGNLLCYRYKPEEEHNRNG